jgi:hypothetical protein
MLRTERMTQQSSRLSDPVESCATSASQSLQEKSWTDGLKSQEGGGTQPGAKTAIASERRQQRAGLELCLALGLGLGFELGPLWNRLLENDRAPPSRVPIDSI